MSGGAHGALVFGSCKVPASPLHRKAPLFGHKQLGEASY